MATLEHEEALVLFRRSEKAVEGLLRRFSRKHEIVAAIDDQRGNRHPRGEIDLIWDAVVRRSAN
jgi:hypothetical protein